MNYDEEMERTFHPENFDSPQYCRICGEEITAEDAENFDGICQECYSKSEI